MSADGRGQDRSGVISLKRPLATNQLRSANISSSARSISYFKEDVEYTDQRGNDLSTVLESRKRESPVPVMTDQTRTGLEQHLVAQSVAPVAHFH